MGKCLAAAATLNFEKIKWVELKCWRSIQIQSYLIRILYSVVYYISVNELHLIYIQKYNIGEESLK